MQSALPSFYKPGRAWIKVTIVLLVAFLLGFILTPLVAEGQGLLNVLRVEPPRVIEIPELEDPAYGLIHLQRLALLFRIIGRSIQIIGAAQFFAHCARGIKMIPRWKPATFQCGKGILTLAGAQILVFMLQQLTVLCTKVDPFD